ncbi:predicted protein, partial [Sclerotinia sclerotiorum 1980 UF-70]
NFRRKNYVSRQGDNIWKYLTELAGLMTLLYALSLVLYFRANPPFGPLSLPKMTTVNIYK